jgi:hypothetical protein
MEEVFTSFAVVDCNPCSAITWSLKKSHWDMDLAILHFVVQTCPRWLVPAVTVGSIDVAPSFG